MGTCLSCLGLRTHESDDYDPSEASHLLASDSAYQPRYGIDGRGSTNAPTGPLSQPQQPAQDEEELRKERQELERICARAASQLIDVSQTTHAMEDGAKLQVDYARLLAETFDVEPVMEQSRDAQDTDTDLTTNAEGATKESGELIERRWLQSILASQPEALRGDWQRVNPIEGKLTFSFEDVVDEDEGQRRKK
ncbi:MAG: hypothetical protein M1828_000735 [Chrysothrix sp. TS-e1954]|nr:MAG: hypothetical protein M1828_000735 [Chrysothrix sp. TS-e1954]